MHELGLCAAIVDAVERRAGPRQVARVRVRVGRLHHVHPEAFEQSFALAAAGSVAGSARADLVLVPVTGRCGACGAEFESDEPLPACPMCRSLAVHVTGGDELTLELIEYLSTDEPSTEGPGTDEPSTDEPSTDEPREVSHVPRDPR